jgi:hypothetical protein
MLGFFFPPVIAVIIGIVVLVVGLALVHSSILIWVGILAVAVGAVRYMRGRSGNGVKQ